MAESTTLFDFIPIVQDRGKAAVAFLSLRGVSMKHGSATTDRGRLYGLVSKASATYTLNLHNAHPIDEDNLIAFGETDDLQSVFEIEEAEDSDSGVTGQASLASYQSDSEFVAVVSFATDIDIMSSQPALSSFPGYDPEFGLTEFHAKAMRELLTSTLPSIAPAIYSGAPINPYIPPSASIDMPDLTKIANPEALRGAQAALVEMNSASQKKYIEEWADIATAAREHFARLIQQIQAANEPAESDAAAGGSSNSFVTFGSFTRM